MRVLMHTPVYVLYRYRPVQMHAFSTVVWLVLWRALCGIFKRVHQDCLFRAAPISRGSRLYMDLIPTEDLGSLFVPLS